MATLNHFPNFHSFSAHKLFFSSPFHLQSSHKCHYSTIFACSLIKPARGNKKVKSNVDLCNEIREFLSSVGLPENHVPSTKELSQHGRQDLANIVRRRGYKFIRQLLETSSTENFIGSNTDTVQTVKLDVLGSKGQNEELKVLSDDVMANEGVQDEDFNGFKDQGFFAPESSTLSLHKKAAKFIRDGELDATEDISFGIPNEKHDIESEDTHEQELDSDAETLNGNISSSDEIKRLKFLLHQKELELTQLKQQIEKEKLALSILQTKAETEITKAQKLISEKEIELHAAEETLSGLKEVEIQYSGNGETVELAGSFNGWHHKIKMDLQPSSSITNPSESRTSRLWKAVLWLYPGVYEIKFVIDGHWVVDPQRESVTRDSVHNNILRVDR